MKEFSKNEKESGVLIYAKTKLEEVGELEAPCAAMHSTDELSMLFDLAKEDRSMAIHYALCIGFANGIKYKAGKINA